MRDARYIKNMVLTALFIASGLLLPSFFHFVGAGAAFLPLHLPVLVCGLVCGWQWGLLAGLTLPLLSSLTTGMPPLYPVACAMTFELAAYGFFTGWLLPRFSARRAGFYTSLIAAMLGGRLVSGAAQVVLFGLAGLPFGWRIFVVGAFVTALPGILLQLLLVPPLAMAINRLLAYRAAPINGEL
ncbi:MAG: ECF transporter S component [Clostridiales bacterium]|nr:ECF transporter S component [Clostridiales bacterium]